MGANAQTSVPLFVANSVLTAAQQNISAATGVPVFATTVTRDAAFGGSNKALAEGQLCYLESTNVVQQYNGTAWETVGPGASKIAQVVVAQTNTSFSTSSGTYVDVTGLSATITPTTNTSKILVMFTANVSANSSNMIISCQLDRNGTAIPGGGGFISLTNAMFVAANAFEINAMAINYQDSPASTSALTYKIQTYTNGGTIYFFRRSDTTTVSSFGSLVLIEVLA
jgi:hypothetical protein